MGGTHWVLYLPEQHALQICCPGPSSQDPKGSIQHSADLAWELLVRSETPIPHVVYELQRCNVVQISALNTMPDACHLA